MCEETLLRNKYVSLLIPKLNHTYSSGKGESKGEKRSDTEREEYRQPSLYAVFLSAILRICDPKMASFLGLIL